jgi:hypothetical protein
MIAEVREKLRVDESLASVDEEVDANVDVEIDVDVAVEKVRILEKRESMRAVEKRREEDFMVFRAIDESLSRKGEGRRELCHLLATIKYLGRRGCIRLENYSLGVGHPVELGRHTIAVLSRRTILAVLYRHTVPYGGSTVLLLG